MSRKKHCDLPKLAKESEADLKRLAKLYRKAFSTLSLTKKEGKDLFAGLFNLKKPLTISATETIVPWNSKEAKRASVKPRQLLAAGKGEMLICEAAKLMRMTTGGVRAAAQRGSIKTRKASNRGPILVDAGSLREYMRKTGRRVPSLATT